VVVCDTTHRVTDEDLTSKVVALRAEGRSPKQIAQVLGVRPATVASLVRRIASQQPEARGEPALAGCWVSPGWSRGLSHEGHAEWPDGTDGTGGAGLVGVVVARQHRYERVSVCGYLVDVYCLGVKDVVGPRAVTERELPAFLGRFFGAFASPPLEAPIDLAQHLVWGAVAYARELGFEPARGFDAAAGHLGDLGEASAIRFGRDGKPVFLQGPNDDAGRILSTLRGSVGEGNFEFVAGGPAEPRAATAPRRPGAAMPGGRRSGDVSREGRHWRTGNR
jgi:hypothetical protein